MIDKDRVIGGLAALAIFLADKKDPISDEQAQICTSAVELLKEQKGVKPVNEACGACGYILHRINYDSPDKELRHEWFRFCPNCGKAANWYD
jgi:uncharacterized protein with PIN domain